MERILILSLLTLLCTQMHAQDKWDNIVDRIVFEQYKTCGIVCL